MPDAILSGPAAAKLGHVETWKVDIDATPVAPDDDSAAAGQVAVTAGRKETSLFAQNDQLTLTSANTGVTTGRISSVETESTLTVDITSGNLLTEYVAEREIPAVGSGSPVAALDLTQQLVLGRRCSYYLDNGTCTYWSLAGHDVGLDGNSKVVYGKNLDQITLDANSTPVRTPYTEQSFVASGYAERNGALYATEGYGSTFPLVVKRKVSVMYTLFMDTNTVHTMRWDAGPDNSNTGTGKSLLLTIDQALNTAVLDITYRNGGALTHLSYDADLTFVSQLDWSQEFRIIVEQEYRSRSDWYVNFEIVQGQFGKWKTLAPETSSLSTTMDAWALPWVLQGACFRDLVIVDGTSGYIMDNVLGGALITPESDHYDTTELSDCGLTSYPIAGMTGSLWDYIKQVTGGSGFEFHADRGDVIRVVMAGDDVQDLPNYVGPIRRSVSDEGATQMLEFKNYNTDLPDARYKPRSYLDTGFYMPLGLGSFRVYDSQLAGETWSIGVNEVQTVELNVDHFPSIVQNPKPASTRTNQKYVS